jgi:hypothetical protein
MMKRKILTRMIELTQKFDPIEREYFTAKSISEGLQISRNLASQ